MSKKQNYKCWHAHDYSTIEGPKGLSIDISTPEPFTIGDVSEEDQREYEEAQEDVETVTNMLNEHGQLKTQLRWALKELRNMGITEEMEKRYSKAEKLLK